MMGVKGNDRETRNWEEQARDKASQPPGTLKRRGMAPTNGNITKEHPHVLTWWMLVLLSHCVCVCVCVCGGGGGGGGTERGMPQGGGRKPPPQKITTPTNMFRDGTDTVDSNH